MTWLDVSHIYTPSLQKKLPKCAYLPEIKLGVLEKISIFRSSKKRFLLPRFSENFVMCLLHLQQPFCLMFSSVSATEMTHYRREKGSRNQFLWLTCLNRHQNITRWSEGTFSNFLCHLHSNYISFKGRMRSDDKKPEGTDENNETYYSAQAVLKLIF